MDVLIRYRRPTGSTAETRRRTLARAHDLALALILLASLLAPLAGTPPVTVAAELEATSSVASVFRGDGEARTENEGMQGDGGDSAGLASPPVVGPIGLLVAAGPLAGLAGVAAWRVRRPRATRRGPSSATGATDIELVRLATSRVDADRARWEETYWLGR